MGERKDILYILSTVGLLAVLGLYLAFTQGQTISSVINIPFRNSPAPTTSQEQSQNPTESPGNTQVTPSAIQNGGENLDEGDYFAIFETNLGTFEVDLAENNAPNSVKNFSFLANNNYYNDTSFHRYLPNLLIQGGSRNTLNSDPEDDRYGGPGYVIDDEINWDSLGFSQDKKNSLAEEGYSSKEDLESLPMDKHTIAWASNAPNSNGSQFFIVLGSKDDPKIQNLEGRHTVFGKVVKGTEVVDKIANLQVNLDNLDEPRPAADVIVKSIKIEIR